jgi:tetratricopeptide (TPR) repeat protein
MPTRAWASSTIDSRNSTSRAIVSAGPCSLYLQRRWAEAETAFHQALAVAPEHARAHNNLGLLLARTDRPEPALQQFRLAGCDLAQARVNLAFALALDAHWDEARRQYESALAADPTCEPARTGLQDLDRLVAHTRPGYVPGTLRDENMEMTRLLNPAGETCLARTFFRFHSSDQP